MEKLADRVKETTTTTGTGDITTAGAVSGFQTINTAIGQNIYTSYVLLDANGTGWETGKGYLSTVTYVLLDANGTGWETGKGYLSTATNFKRTTVFASTNSNNAISLSTGTHTIFIDATGKYFLNMTGKMLAMSKSLAMP